MKKRFLGFIIQTLIAVLLFAPQAFADWSITVTWTPSIGPELASETVLYDGTERCTVSSGDSATCSFITPDLGGSVVVRSTNSQGAFTETTPVLVSSQPTPAAGVNVHVTYVAP